MQQSESVTVAIKQRARPDEPKNIGSVCACGQPKPGASVWWKLKFADGAVLSLSAEQFYLVGNCPIAALGQLVNEFGIVVDDDGIHAPFPFIGPDDGHACRFLHAVMRLSIVNYDRRCNPWVGSC